MKKSTRYSIHPGFARELAYRDNLASRSGWPSTGVPTDSEARSRWNAREVAMRFLRVRQVMQMTGLSRMTIYRLELAGKFPKRRQLGENSVAWLESDITAWAESRRGW